MQRYASVRYVLFVPDSSPPPPPLTFLDQVLIIWRRDSHHNYTTFADQFRNSGLALPLAESLPQLNDSQKIGTYFFVYLSLGRMYEDNGKLDDAISLYAKIQISSCPPKFLSALYMTIARCYEKKGLIHLAFEYYELALAHASIKDRNKAIEAKGRLYQRLEDYENAENCFKSMTPSYQRDTCLRFLARNAPPARDQVSSPCFSGSQTLSSTQRTDTCPAPPVQPRCPTPL